MGVESAAEPPPAVAATPAAAGRHALIIEDEPHIAEALRFILVRDGWRVSHHAEGTGAAEAVVRLAPDIVLLDVMLPGASGHEVLSRLRADPATAAVPIVILTARTGEADRAEATRRGATRVIAKPFANAEIVAAVRALVPG